MKPLSVLVMAVKNLLAREGQAKFQHPFIAPDIAVMLNQMKTVFDLLCLINADDTRDYDPRFHHGYSFVSFPLVRNIIDSFYNITALLNDQSKAKLFRTSGYKRLLKQLDEDELYYPDRQGWAEYIAQQRLMITKCYTSDKLTLEDIRESDDWQLLGRYLSSTPRGTSHKKLMRQFVRGPWGKYSEMSHATFAGILETYQFLNTDEAPHELRPQILAHAELWLAEHLGRAATLLISVITEIQSACDFSGHNINLRIIEAWQAAIAFPEAKDIYDFRYAKLMEDKGIALAAARQ
jgi:hypothetical protein